jgi:ferredoxin
MKQLPMQFSFNMDIVGEQSQKTYKGKFTYEMPTIGIKQQIANSSYDRRMQSDNFDPEYHEVMDICDNLKYCLKECPDWFKKSDYGLHIKDEAPLIEISDQITKFTLKRESLRNE